MHAAANSAAVAAASGGNLADYLWSPQPSSVSGGSMIPHPLSLQHLRPPTHATSLMSHFASSNNAAQLQTSPHLPFPTNPFFWPKRAFETPADSLLGIFGINILHVLKWRQIIGYGSTVIDFLLYFAESASAVAAAEAMNINKHHDACHSNEYKMGERSSMIGGFRGAQNATSRCVPPTIPMDIFQWMEQRRQLATAAAAAAAHVAEARSSISDAEKQYL